MSTREELLIDARREQTQERLERKGYKYCQWCGLMFEGKECTECGEAGEVNEDDPREDR